MRRRFFIKLSIITTFITYLAVFFSLYSPQVQNYVNIMFKANKVNANVTQISCNAKKTLIAEGAFFTPCLNSDGKKLLYSSGYNIYEMDMETKNTKQLTFLGNCYNPIYYEKDNNIIAFARNNGIFLLNISENKIEKIIVNENPQVSYAKPNFTKDGDIIYFKVTVLPNPEGRGFIEQNPGIYKISKDGKINEKVIEGYNPTLYKDGKTLCYELKNNIYVIDLETRKNKFIDEGKYAAWSNDGKYISYSKFQKNICKYTKQKNNKTLFVDKEYSNIFITSVNNNRNKTKITNEVFEKREEEIERWANDLKHSNMEQHFLTVSRQVFFDTVWNKENKSILVSLYDSSKGGFELLKYEIETK